MSKATSTGGEADALEPSAEERMVALVWRWFPVGIVLGTGAAGVFLGAGFGVLVLAAGAFIMAISSMWGSVRSLFGETPLAGEDAFAIGSPSAEEEQKRAILRAIKDLEFERGVGKISERDYKELIAKYRAEAKRLLRVLDERATPARKEAEALADAHLAELGIERAALEEEETAEAPEKAKGKGKRKGKRKPKKEEPFEDLEEDDDLDEDGDEGEDEVAADADEADDEDADEDGDEADGADDDEADGADDDEADGADDDEADDEDEDDADEDDSDDADEDDSDDYEDDDGDFEHEHEHEHEHEGGGRVECPNCGASNELDAAFCKKCATKLSGDEEEEGDA